jgi:hypothetical protein
LLTLEDLTRLPRSVPLVLVQTGDVEAYGGTETRNQYLPTWSFPALDFWQGVCTTLSADFDAIFNLFGNHDVWPGTLPILKPAAAGIVEANLRGRSEFIGPLPDMKSISSGLYDLEFIRLNTVQSHFAKNFFARGRISSDNNSDPVSALLHCTNRTFHSSRIVIRTLIMHHPPHFFTIAGPSHRLLEGDISNTGILKNLFQNTRVHIVLAGHRHSVNPTGPGILNQPPLPYDSVQLVAGSATQYDPNSTERPSFCVYSIFADDSRMIMDVERVLYRHVSDLDSRFTAVTRELIVSGLPV